MKDVIIIGGGLAGLTAANYLQQRGRSFLLLEATDRVGGRVKTEEKEGFLLDHGFQVFATAYPEAKALLDYDKLDLQKFLPGAVLLQPDGSRDRIGDPLRDWGSLIPTLRARAGSWKSKLNILRLKWALQSKSLPEIFAAEERPTMKVLKEEYGFDEQLANRFFKPFYSGIFLERELETSRRMFDFVFKMFAEGEVAVPNTGMEAIPRQLAANLPEDSILLNAPVERVKKGRVFTADGHSYEGRCVLFATQANKLVKEYFPDTQKFFVSTTHVHFTAPTPPLDKPIIALNTFPRALANSVTVMSQVAEGYAPHGQHLISVSIVGKTELSEEMLEKRLREELQLWFGKEVEAWKLLDVRVVNYALPRQKEVRHDITADELQRGGHHFVCGDHLLNGSINAAMRTGRLAAEAIDAHLGQQLIN